MKQVFSISFRAALFIILRKSYKTILVKLIRIANDPKIELYMTPLKIRFLPGSIKGLIYH